MNNFFGEVLLEIVGFILFHLRYIARQNKKGILVEKYLHKYSIAGRIIFLQLFALIVIGGILSLLLAVIYRIIFPAPIP